MSDYKLKWKHLWHTALPEESSVEDLYQAFKERLMEELVAEREAKPILGDPSFCTPAERFRPVPSTEGGRMSLVTELAETLERYVNAYPAFRIKPIGAPGSQARTEQERLMVLEEVATALIQEAKKRKP